MSQEINHHCKICGKGYHVCNDCQNTASFTPWRVLTDNLEHYKIYLIIRDYTNGHLTKEQAKELLEQRCLTGMNEFLPEVMAVMVELLEEDDDMSQVIEDTLQSAMVMNDSSNTL